MYGERGGVIRVMMGKPEGRDHLKEPCVDGRIISRLIFRNWNVVEWTGSIWLRIETGGSTCECGKEPSGSVK